MKNFILPTGTRTFIKVGGIPPQKMITDNNGTKPDPNFKPLRVGDGHHVVIDLENNGVWIDLVGIAPCEFDVGLTSDAGGAFKFHVSAQEPSIPDPNAVDLV